MAGDGRGLKGHLAEKRSPEVRSTRPRSPLAASPATALGPPPRRPRSWGRLTPFCGQWLLSPPVTLRFPTPQQGWGRRRPPGQPTSAASSPTALCGRAGCGVRGARWPPTGCPRRARPLGGGASRTRHTAVTGEGVAPWSRPAGQHWPVDPEPGSAGQHWPRSGLHRPHHCDLLCPLPEPGPDEQAGGFLKPTRSPPAQGPRPAHALVPVETEQLFFCSKKEEGRREGEGASLRADVGVLGAPPNPCHGDVKGTVGLEAGNDPAPRLACADTTGLTRFPLPPPAGVGGRRVWPEQQLLTLLGISRLCRGP